MENIKFIDNNNKHEIDEINKKPESPCDFILNNQLGLRQEPNHLQYLNNLTIGHYSFIFYDATLIKIRLDYKDPDTCREQHALTIFDKGHSPAMFIFC